MSELVSLLHSWVAALCVWLADTVLALGYPGIIFLMAVESSLVPFPSELVMPPAGYLVHEGRLSWAGTIASGTAGCLIGALFNYYLAYYLGRPFFLRYGKYFFLTPEHLERTETFFAKHGEITTFVGRLIPVVRQFISLPAGLSRMSLGKFCLYTALGGGAWVSVLTAVGWLVGRNREMLDEYLASASVWALAFAALVVVLYVRLRKK